MASRSIVLVLSSNIRGLTEGLLSASGALDGLNSNVVRVGAAITASLGAATAAAAQFQATMANVSTVSQSTAKDMAGISQTVLDMSRTLPQSANTLAEGLYDVASSGFDGAEAVTILEASAKAASAGLTDTATSARAVTSIINAYGLGASDAADISDTLFQVVNKGVVTFEELSLQLGDFVSLAAASGVPIDEAGAALATMTLGGQRAAVAATNLRGIFSALLEPTAEMANMLEQLGYASGQQALETDGLTGVMEKMRIKTGGNADEVTRLFGRIEAATGALSLMADNGETFNRVAAEITDKTARMGATQTAFTRQSATFSAQFKLLRNNIEATAIEVGQNLLPAMTKLVDISRDAATALGPGVGVALSNIGTALGEVGGFLQDHAGYVLGVAAAYTLSLVPGVLATARTFVLLIPHLAAAIAQMITLRGALLALGYAAGAVALGAVIQGLFNAKEQARGLITELEKGQDLTTLEGLSNSIQKVNDKLTESMEEWHKYDGVKGILQGTIELLTPMENKVLDNATAVKALTAEEERLAGAQAILKDNLESAAARWGISTAAVERFAKAAGIDLSQWEGTAEAIDQAISAATDADPAIRRLDDALTNLGRTVETSEETLDAFRDSLDVLNVYTDALAGVREAEAARAESVRNNARDASDSIQRQNDLARDALEERQRAEQDILESERITGSASRERHRRAVEDMRKRHDEERRILEDSQKAEEERAAATEAAEQKRAEAIEASGKKAVISMEEYRRKIAENTEQTKEWARNLTTIARRGGPTGEAFRDKLAELGPEAAGLIAQIADSTDAEFAKFQTTFEEAGEAGVTALEDEFSVLPLSLGSVGQQAGKAFIEGLRSELQKGSDSVGEILEQLFIKGFNYDQLASAGIVAGPVNPNRISRRAEGHVAQFAAAGEWRIWAEPETGGEAYIPLSPAKRPRSKALWAEVGRQFGMRAVPMADGGLWPGGGSYPAGAAPGVDLAAMVARLERTLASRRPVQMQNVFNEKVDPKHVSRQIAWTLS